MLYKPHLALRIGSIVIAATIIGIGLVMHFSKNSERYGWSIISEIILVLFMYFPFSLMTTRIELTGDGLAYGSIKTRKIKIKYNAIKSVISEFYFFHGYILSYDAGNWIKKIVLIPMENRNIFFEELKKNAPHVYVKK